MLPVTRSSRRLISFVTATALVLPAVTGTAQEAAPLPPIPEPHPVRIANLPAADFAEAAARLFGDAGVEAGGGNGLTSPAYLLEAAFGRLEDGNASGAVQIAAASGNPAAVKLIEWLIAIDGYDGIDAERMAEAADAVADWPGRTLMRIRYEQAVRRGEPTPEQAIAALAPEPVVLEPSILLLARSYVAFGWTAEAERLVREIWRQRTFSEELETILLEEFGGFLSVDDHRYRMSRLLYDGANDAALRVAALLSDEMQALAEAWAAVNRGSSNASGMLDAVPATVRSDPGYIYARLRHLVRTGAFRNAADLLEGAPTDAAVLIDPEAWSVQRRDLGLALIRLGDTETAYSVFASHSALDRGEVAEIEFLAGWAALQFLDEPDRAIQHFEALAGSSSLPLSQSRAHYWLGRAYDRLGDNEEAQREYGIAAGYHLTYYGQLAIEALGGGELPIAPEPAIDETVIAGFLGNEIVQAMIWLDRFGRRTEADLLARHLGEALDDAAEIDLLAQLAEARGDHQLALQIGKFAANRGLPVDATAFSMAALPDGVPGDHVEPALVFAVARQESAFNFNAVSSAGAVGLIQILPATAREMAAYVGVAFSEGRLTEPGYNALLGGAYLATLLDRYDGNLVLTLAAFNAGLTRADRWIEVYGDPRSGDVDPIDWIEQIPFDETRNYVQRVLENLQVYRARLGEPELRLAEDLGLAR